MFDMDLRGKTALVTGAAQGMGRATAEICAEAFTASAVAVDGGYLSR